MTRRRPLGVLIATVLAVVVSVAPVPFGGSQGTSYAADPPFDPNLLITDAIFDASGSMTTAQIQSLLDRYPNSCLRTYKAAAPLDYSTYGVNVSAAEVVKRSADLYGVNPQVLLATLEKEQSMVTGGGGCQPWRYWSAMGYACPDGGARYNYPALGITETCVSSQQHAGFSAQVNHGAWQLQFNRQRAIGNLNWRDNQNVPNYGYYTKGYRQQYAGAATIYYDGTATIGGQLITMTNGPTATLYTYTPHVSANKAFVQIFTAWFGSPTATTTVTTTTWVAPTTTKPAPPTTPSVPTTTAPATPYPWDRYTTFTDGVYQLLAGRRATSDEQSAWATYLSGGGSVDAFVRLMAAVPEHAEHQVTVDYVRMLRRAPDPSGAASWVRTLQSSGRNDVVLTGMAGSSEYFARCSSDPGLYVQCIYLDLLGRAADPGGQVSWTSQITSGTLSRRTVADRFAASSEYATNFVDQMYREILGRRADPGGLGIWTDVYRRSRSEASVRVGLIASTEGFRRLAGVS